MNWWLSFEEWISEELRQISTMRRFSPWFFRRFCPKDVDRVFLTGGFFILFQRLGESSKRDLERREFEVETSLRR
jgi:hypothetical protein